MRQTDESFKEIKADMTDIKQVNFVLPVRIAFLEWKRWQLSDQYSRGKCLEVSRINTEKCFSKELVRLGIMLFHKILNPAILNKSRRDSFKI